ncbi:hypothetical protein QQG55_4800 [Brugia pahangi]
MANALSNGYRKQPVEHNEKKRFVFGSSTPRDLSYMYSIPTIRNYDSKMKPIKQVKDQTLSYYMRQARSITRNQSGSREGSGDRVIRGTFAFGSSTPRILSHLCGVTKEYDRIYPQVGRRSCTTPTFPISRSKTVGASTDVQIRRIDGITQKPSGMVAKKDTRSVISTNQSKERSEKFMDFVKKNLESENDKAKLMKKVVAKDRQQKSQKAGSGRKAPVGKEFIKTGFSQISTKLSPASAINKGSKPEATLIEQRQLLVASTIEDETRLFPARSIPVEEIITKEVAEYKSNSKVSRTDSLRENRIVQILHKESEGREIDISSHLRSIEQDDRTGIFSVVSETNHVKMNVKSNSENKDETGEELSNNSGPGKCEASLSIELYGATPIAMTTDPAISPIKLSLSLTSDKIFSLLNDDSEPKDDHYLKSSEDKFKDRGTLVDSGPK